MGLVSKLAAGAFTASLLATGVATPAVADGPALTASCTLSGTTPRYSGTYSGFPPETLNALTVYFDNTGTFAIDGTVPIGADGTWTFLGNPGPAIPNRIAIAVYRDTNKNSHWDPNSDQTFFRSDGAFDTCPTTVTFAPK